MLSAVVKRVGDGSMHEDCKDLLPNVIRCSSAISACAKGGQWLHVQGFIVGIRHNDELPDVITYNAAISAYEKGKGWLRALRLLHLCHQRL